MHRASARFWKLFARLPESIQRVARKNFELLKEDRSHPSLHFKKVEMSGRPGLESITARWRSRMVLTSFGCGSARTTNTHA
jgi:hypothetical protein